MDDDTLGINSKTQTFEIEINTAEEKNEPFINYYIKDLRKEYIIEKYDPSCEEHNQIKKIIPLDISKPKIIIFIILNLCTAFIINLCIEWWPKLKLYLRYKIVPLAESKYVGIYSKDGSFYVEKLTRQEIPKISNKYIINDLCEDHSNSLISFKFKLFTYIYNEKSQQFTSTQFNLVSSKIDIQSILVNGLTQKEKQYQRIIYGNCDLDIYISSIPRLFFNEFSDPFYLFQIFSICLWFFDEYVSYASFIIFATAVSLIQAVYETRKNLVNIQQLARYNIPINIYTKDDIDVKDFNESSINLVPGDVYILPDVGCSLPCDSLLLSGTVIVNESILTGESTPILKSEMPCIDEMFDYEKDKKYFLFAGTKIVQKRNIKNKPVIALCLNTGFNTVKGNLIRGILFPKIVKNKFEKDSYKYILIMSILAGIGFCICFKFLYEVNTLKEVMLKCLDLITTVVPPSLPACLGIGISSSLRRMKKHGIFCINRDKVNSLGKVNMIVFDKTGTLTEDHLDVSGFLTCKGNPQNEQITKLKTEKYNDINNKDNNGLIKINKEEMINTNENSDSLSDSNSSISNCILFDKYYKSISSLSKKIYNYYKEKLISKKVKRHKEILQMYIECLATCHGLSKINDKLVGDPIDVKMFEGVGWILRESVNESDAKNTDLLMSTYVRPKEEEELEKQIQKAKDEFKFKRDQKLNNDDEEEENEQLESEIDKIISSHYEIGIVKRFDFSSKLQRMSVLVKNANEEYFKIFCKGSPEKIKELCKPMTIPTDFNDQLVKYTSKGYRVLACAGKLLKANYRQCQGIEREVAERNLVFLGLLIVQNKLKEPTASSIESLDKANLKMVMATGDNILTAIAVSKDCKLIPGGATVYTCEFDPVDNNLKWNIVENFQEDNLDDEEENLEQNNGIMRYTNRLTIDDEQEIELSSMAMLLPEIYMANNNNIPIIDTDGVKNNKINVNNINTNINNNELKEDREKLKENGDEQNLPDDIKINIEQIPFKKSINEDIVIAITGQTFEILKKLSSKYTPPPIPNNPLKPLEKNKQPLFPHIKNSEQISSNMTENSNNTNLKYKTYYDVFRLILRYGIVYARMAPEHKALLVQSLQNEKLTTLMCGDGANDVAALKVADAGVSLSQEEASIAAPFTSTIPDISCLINVLREGKCALVTSIQTFKYMMIYSLIQFIVVTYLTYFNSYLSDNQYLACDLFIIFPLEFFMALTHPCDKLTYHSPNGALISVPIISSILIECGIQAFFIIFGNSYVRKNYQGYYDFNCANDPDTSPCFTNTVVYSISNLQYLTTAFAFNISKPFRKKICTNIGLTLFMVLSFAYSVYIILYVDQAFTHEYLILLNYDRNNKTKINIKWHILILVALNFVVSFLCERFFIPFIDKLNKKRKINKIKDIIMGNYEYNLKMAKDFKDFMKKNKRKGSVEEIKKNTA